MSTKFIPQTKEEIKYAYLKSLREQQANNNGKVKLYDVINGSFIFIDVPFRREQCYDFFCELVEDGEIIVDCKQFSRQQLFSELADCNVHLVTLKEIIQAQRV